MSNSVVGIPTFVDTRVKRIWSPETSLYYFNITILIIIGVLAILTVIYFFLVNVNKYDDTLYRVIGYSFLGAISIFTIVNMIML